MGQRLVNSISPVLPTSWPSKIVGASASATGSSMQPPISSCKAEDKSGVLCLASRQAFLHLDAALNCCPARVPVAALQQPQLLICNSPCCCLATAPVADLQQPLPHAKGGMRGLIFGNPCQLFLCMCAQQHISHGVKVLCYAETSAEVLFSAKRECCGMLVRMVLMVCQRHNRAMPALR